MKHLRKKKPVLVEQGWFFHWENAPVHIAAIIQHWLTAHNGQVLRYSPYSPDLALWTRLVSAREGKAGGRHLGP
jgi:hypothetical protein